MKDPEMVEMHHPRGIVRVHSLENGSKEIHVELTDPSEFSPWRKWCTRYDPALIQAILDVKGPAYLCDEIRREEDPSYVQRLLEFEIGAYLPDYSEREERILDFGCGSGSSTLVLSRMFPRCEIVGVELVEEYLRLADLRALKLNATRVRFHLSENGDGVPEGLGEFDYIVLSAVYEHLLPLERERLLPRLWSLLRDGGILFLGQTPNRWFPIETHTTGIPLLNYTPAPLAFWIARNFSKRVKGISSWEELLRMGIRGGSVRTILRQLSGGSSRPRLLEPSLPDIRDRIDLWYSLSNREHHALIKRSARYGFKIIKVLTGYEVVPHLSLAFQKSG